MCQHNFVYLYPQKSQVPIEKAKAFLNATISQNTHFLICEKCNTLARKSFLGKTIRLKFDSQYIKDQIDFAQSVWNLIK